MSIAEITLLSLVLLLWLVVIHLHTEQNKLRRLLPFKKTSTKKPVKILSVVAGQDLDMTEIEKSLYSTDLQYNLLDYKNVTQESILSELAKNVTIFELSSHGLNGSFRIGNDTLPISWLKAALNTSPDLECVLLLYCNSYQDLSQVATNTTFKVGLVGDVSDHSCIMFAKYFYYYVGRKYTYDKAYEAARLFLPVKEFGNFIYQWQQ